MISRCENPKNIRFNLYGGAGVTVCERWRRSYLNFLSDVGRKPSPEHSIDRYPNPNGNYEPGNVRWATRKEQANNLRTSARFEFRGKSMTVAELAEHAAVNYKTLAWRLRHGMAVEDAMFLPLRKNGYAYK
jgi:hypothetical protein